MTPAENRSIVAYALSATLVLAAVLAVATPVQAGAFCTGGTAATFEFARGSFEVDENNGTVTLTIKRTGGTPNCFADIDWTTTAGTAHDGDDFEGGAGTVAMGWQEGQDDFDIPILDDVCNEGTEAFTISISSTNGEIGTRDTATVRILENDDSTCTFRFSSATYTGTEGGTATIQILRGGPIGFATTIDWAATLGTADSDDFVAISGTLLFESGESTRSVTVGLPDDDEADGDKTVNIVLSNPRFGVQLATPSSAVLTILDNDEAGTESPTGSVTDTGTSDGTDTATGTSTGTKEGPALGLLIAVVALGALVFLVRRRL